jgi:hypothetical protein
VRRYCLLLLLCSAALLLASCGRGPETGPEPVTTLVAQDRPDDTGGAIDLDWSGYTPPENFDHYKIYRSRSPIPTVSGLRSIAKVAPLEESADAETSYTDSSVTDGFDYYYAVTAVDADDRMRRRSVTSVGPVQSVRQAPGPAPPVRVQVEDDDNPKDPGGVVNVSWAASPDEGDIENPVTSYEIVRLEEREGEETSVGQVDAGTTEFQAMGAHWRTEYYYGVRALAGEARSEIPKSDPLVAPGRWFNVGVINVLVSLLVYSAVVLLFIVVARKGQELYVRPIAGIEALDDAIGRATEMGRPILYVSGLGDAADISTIAAMLILRRVAGRIAEYETPLIVPCRDPIVMSTEREIVRQAYLEAGHADAFDPDSVFFVTDSQFAYVAAVDGIMLRDRPAANIYMGSFFAESLILAETGASTGAIQIAGTDSDTQLPFFITTCDYTLMGEELYAASAYLSRDPLMLGTLKGQDMGKVAIGAALLVGAILTTLAVFLGQGWPWLQQLADGFVGLFSQG